MARMTKGEALRLAMSDDLWDEHRTSDEEITAAIDALDRASWTEEVLTAQAVLSDALNYRDQMAHRAESSYNLPR